MMSVPVTKKNKNKLGVKYEWSKEIYILHRFGSSLGPEIPKKKSKKSLTSQ